MNKKIRLRFSVVIILSTHIKVIISSVPWSPNISFST